MYEDNKEFLVNGKTMTTKDICNKWSIPDNQRDAIIDRLLKANKISEKKQALKEDDSIAEFIAKQEKLDKAEEVIKEEKAYEQAKRNAKVAERDVIKIELSFRTTTDANKAQIWINSLGIDDTEIALKKDTVLLRVNGITLDEYAKIAKRYNTEKVIRNGVELTDKAINSLVSGVNYAATNIIAPGGAIAVKGAMNIGKGLIHTASKLGATVINDGAQAVAETKTALDNDSEMIKAKAQLQNAKESIFGFISKKMKHNNGSGIKIVD